MARTVTDKAPRKTGHLAETHRTRDGIIFFEVAGSNNVSCVPRGGLAAAARTKKNPPPRELGARVKLVSSLVVCIYPSVHTPAPTYMYMYRAERDARAAVHVPLRARLYSHRTKETAREHWNQKRQRVHQLSSSPSAETVDMHARPPHNSTNLKAKHAPTKRYTSSVASPLASDSNGGRSQTHLEDVRVEAGAYLLHGEVVQAGQLVDGGAKSDVGSAPRPGHSRFSSLHGLPQCLAHCCLWNWSGRHSRPARLKRTCTTKQTAATSM